MSEAHSGRRHVRRAAQPSQNGLILSFAPARLAIALTVARQQAEMLKVGHGSQPRTATVGPRRAAYRSSAHIPSASSSSTCCSWA
jgi:hypothetical protein